MNKIGAIKMMKKMTRKQQLEKMGFIRNDDQRSYCLLKYGNSLYVDFWELNSSEEDWDKRIKTIKDSVETERKLNKHIIIRKQTWVIFGLLSLFVGILIGKFIL